MPLIFAAEGVDKIILKYLHLPADRSRTWRRGSTWSTASSTRRTRSRSTWSASTSSTEDSYKSLNEALDHGGFPHGLKVNFRWVEAEALEEPDGARLLDGADGILVPGGFGTAARAGMMTAAEVARDAEDPVLRHLLRLPVGDRRIRA